MIDMAEYIKLLIALVAIIDIPGNIPVFIQQTANFGTRGRLISALVASGVSCLILLIFAAVGEAILANFGITIASFKILGGIVVILIALELLGFMGGGAVDINREGSDHGPIAVGIFPLAVPMFAGPGSITAVMVYTHEGVHEHHDPLVVAVIVSASIILLAGLIFAGFLSRFIGALTQIVMNRLLGMLVGALGVEFVLEGLAEFFPAFAG